MKDTLMASKVSNTVGRSANKTQAVTTWAVKEVRRFLVLFLYLWILFGLFVLNEAIVYRQQGLHFVFQGLAILNALILAKVMLVFEELDVARWLKREPIALTIVFEALLCTLLFLCFHVAERLAVGLLHGGGVAASVPSFGGGGLLGVMIAASIILISLLPFFTFKHVARAIGAERMKDILFRYPETSTSLNQHDA